MGANHPVRRMRRGSNLFLCEATETNARSWKIVITHTTRAKAAEANMRWFAGSWPAQIRAIGNIANCLKQERAEDRLLLRKKDEHNFESASNKRMQWSAASEFLIIA
jgi:hypothetical protein